MMMSPRFTGSFAAKSSETTLIDPDGDVVTGGYENGHPNVDQFSRNNQHG